MRPWTGFRKKPCPAPSQCRARAESVCEIHQRPKIRFLVKRELRINRVKPRKKSCVRMGLGLTHGKRACAPWATTVNFGQIGQRGEDRLISQRDKDDTMMGQRAQGCQGGGFLASSQGAGGDENPGILAPICSGLPLLTGVVPECLPLSRKVPVASGNAQEKTIIFRKSSGIDEGNIFRLARGIHLGKHLLRKSFLHPAETLFRPHM